MNNFRVLTKTIYNNYKVGFLEILYSTSRLEITGIILFGSVTTSQVYKTNDLLDVHKSFYIIY